MKFFFSFKLFFADLGYRKMFVYFLEILEALVDVLFSTKHIVGHPLHVCVNGKAMSKIVVERREDSCCRQSIHYFAVARTFLQDLRV